jgi:hypothetical protein
MFTLLSQFDQHVCVLHASLAVLHAINNNIVQKTPTTLARMHASCEKQIAFNKRVPEKQVGQALSTQDYLISC